MIRLRMSATGAALAVLTLLACRDAPTLPADAAGPVVSASISPDSVDEMPGPAQIRYAYTGVDFYDGSHGGQPLLEISVVTEYIGNRAETITKYQISGELSRSDQIVNQQNSYYNPLLWKRWSEIYRVPTGGITCGMSFGADSQHKAWWDVWFRGIVPNWDSGRKIVLSFADPKRAEPCAHAPPGDSTNSGGGGGTGGWINIETCYYWAHFVNGVLVDIELRYCTYDMIPVAEQ